MTQSFELRRRLDGLVYRFERDVDGVYHRQDRRDLTILWECDLGWVARVPGTGLLAGRLWDLPVGAQDDSPAEGRWVSCKGDRSYVYDLVHVPQEGGK
ncbi:MAG: hypothetical protein AAGF36_06360 [Pseudomonadota bacterium]